MFVVHLNYCLLFLVSFLLLNNQFDIFRAKALQRRFYEILNENCNRIRYVTSVIFKIGGINIFYLNFDIISKPLQMLPYRSTNKEIDQS